ncbi:iron-containing alcohol dehydrogenase [Ectobacillus ponti]|uniref:Iron-containing alcohol dehydrogenase n=1 Tax=Ectobacillus ponti TaxID=2961894 RepID=A0AA41X686_9BACI|nr:iron-containing alcohol dehydrogenase [Ectobacillus ponti]MCP8967073.1 iron-containing alcohol dehydrogenase [Ectobacillus ponti]
MSTYQLLMPGRVLYGKDSFTEVGNVARSFGSKVLIVSDPIMEKIGNVARCEQLIHEAGLSSAKYTGVDTEPTDIHVQEALDVCRQEACDVIVAVGGGSCLDTAKAVAVLMTNGGHIRDYASNQKLFAEKALPLIAVPTTAGTGSEVTKVTVIIDTVYDVKMMLPQPELLPAAAIVDPVLTLSCPPSVTAATGVDALCHAIEAYISRRAQPVTDMFALQAIELLIGNLRKVYTDGNDLEARENMALGSMLAGVAFSNASVTLVHGMSRPIGAMFHVPHGVSNAMLLPAVLEFTKESALVRLAVIGRLIKPELQGQADADVAEAVIAEVKQLCQDLQIPNMKTWGIDKDRLEQVVEKMATDALASGSPGNNPRVPTHEEIVALYHVCYDYDFSLSNTVAL